MKLNEIRNNPRTPLQRVNDPVIDRAGVELYVKRLDMIHAEISGNKWYKLKYNLIEAREKGFDTLLTFGGAYSNHIHATASAGKYFNFKTIGIIRGEQHLPLNPTLKFAAEAGMKIEYLDRSSYRKKHSDYIISKLRDCFGDFYLIPEGGSNELAVKGCSEIISDIGRDFDVICTASGTGGTLAGIIAGKNPGQKAIGFSALKGGEFLKDSVGNLLEKSGILPGGKWEIKTDYHFGGYARLKPELLEFMDGFNLRNGIPLEPIYSGKLMYGIYDLIKKNYFRSNSTIVALHNGGMQGLKGLENKIRLWENERTRRSLQK